MKLVICNKKTGRRAQLKVERVACSGKNFQYSARLSSRQTRRLSDVCGALPAEWLLDDGQMLYYGSWHELDIIPVAMEPEQWILYWRRK